MLQARCILRAQSLIFRSKFTKLPRKGKKANIYVPISKGTYIFAILSVKKRTKLTFYIRLFRSNFPQGYLLLWQVLCCPDTRSRMSRCPDLSVRTWRRSSRPFELFDLQSAVGRSYLYRAARIYVVLPYYSVFLPKNLMTAWGYMPFQLSPVTGPCSPAV